MLHEEPNVTLPDIPQIELEKLDRRFSHKSREETFSIGEMGRITQIMIEIGDLY